MSVQAHLFMCIRNFTYKEMTKCKVTCKQINLFSSNVWLLLTSEINSKIILFYKLHLFIVVISNTDWSA